MVRDEARTMGKDLSLLDVGCGKGDFLRYLHTREPAWELTGIDLSPNSPQNGIEFIQGDILDLPLGRTYDVVSSLLVIEHIADVQRFVESLRSVCRPGGMLVVTTNDEQGVLYRAARAMRGVGYAAAYERLYSRHHLNHFSVRTLRRLLEASGLAVIRTYHHNIPVAAVDLPPAGPMKRSVWRSGVLVAFGLGRLMRATFLQTVVCRVPLIEGLGRA
jgi:SAM-dependent methyltransferase